MSNRDDYTLPTPKKSRGRVMWYDANGKGVKEKVSLVKADLVNVDVHGRETSQAQSSPNPTYFVVKPKVPESNEDPRPFPLSWSSKSKKQNDDASSTKLHTGEGSASDLTEDKEDDWTTIDMGGEFEAAKTLHVPGEFEAAKSAVVSGTSSREARSQIGGGKTYTLVSRFTVQEHAEREGVRKGLTEDGEKGWVVV